MAGNHNAGGLPDHRVHRAGIDVLKVQNPGKYVSLPGGHDQIQFKGVMLTDNLQSPRRFGMIAFYRIKSKLGIEIISNLANDFPRL